MPPAVDGEAGGADDIHPLIEDRLSGQLTRRQQQIGKQDQDRAGPADDLDEEVDRRQLARFLST